MIISSLGYGLIASIIFKDFKKLSGKNIADIVCQKCLDKGLLVCNTGRESIKIGPPLIIDTRSINLGISILHEAICETYDEINL